ncbi:TonB-dependent receptor [Lacibacter sp. H407]|uniref:TonB-dependent receptor n=1 Tax=Lacibacter sp. H407 TaxID=3133423 RepID=UPI0030BEB3F1
MRKLFYLLSLLLITLSSAAQSIRINGRVLNQKNEPIPGASISVSEINRSFAADVEGRFSVLLEQGKKYTFTVTAVGFQTKAVDEVEVKANEIDNTLTILMDVAAKEGTEIIIRSTARRENTSGLLSFQRNNTSLSSGLSADFIRRTPDKNTGEVLKRVSGASIQDNKFVIVRGLGDRYNQALINGAQLPSSEPDKKAFSFDVIPSALIDNIIINKTATPDLTGEFAGGLVQINTKDIPTKNSLAFGVGFGFNTQSAFQDFVSNERGSTDYLGFDDRRSIPSSYPMKYGVYNTLPAEERRQISADFRDDVWAEQTSVAGPVQSYNLTWANAVRSEKGGAFGSVIGVTYRNSKLIYNATKELFEKDGQQAFFSYADQQNKYSTTVGAIANFAWTKRNHKVAFKNLFNQLYEDNYYRREGPNTENLQDVRLRSSVLNQRSLLSSQLEGAHTFWRNLKATWNINYSYNSKEQPDLRVLTYGRSLGSNDPFSANLRGNNTNRFFSSLSDHAAGYNVSLAYTFDIGKQKQTIKAGGNALVRFRDFRATIFGFSEPSDASLLTQPFDRIFARDNFIKNGGFEMITALQNPQDKYYGISALNAGFLMFDNKISDKWRLVWGSRVESFQQFLKSQLPGTDKAIIINTEKIDFLPSFNLTYSPASRANIRIAGSRTVARPEFREIAPFTFFDFETIASTAGTPDLKRSSILNADVRFEWYPKAGEVISVAAFYKQFTDPIELRLNSGSVATRRQYEFQNAVSADLYGTEFEIRKNLSFLSKSSEWLERFFLSGNVSVIFSEVLLGNTDPSGNPLPATIRPLQGQSPYLVNAGFQYDSKGGTGVSLLYNKIGQRLALVGNADFGDIYERPRDLLDFQLSQKVLKTKGEVRLTVSDILNQPIQTYENRNAAKAYNKGIDKAFSSYTPGTTITVAFTYDFDLKGK